MDKKNTAIANITKTLAENVSRIQYGEVSVCLKVHSGRVVSVMYSVTENNLKNLAGKRFYKGGFPCVITTTSPVSKGMKNKLK